MPGDLAVSGNRCMHGIEEVEFGRVLGFDAVVLVVEGRDNDHV